MVRVVLMVGGGVTENDESRPFVIVKNGLPNNNVSMLISNHGHRVTTQKAANESDLKYRKGKIFNQTTGDNW